MGIFRWLRRRQRWTLLGMCLGVIGLQVILYHMDKRKAGGHSMDHNKRLDEAMAMVADSQQDDKMHNIMNLGLLQQNNGAKRKRLQAIPDNDLKSSTRDQYSRPIISHQTQMGDQQQQIGENNGEDNNRNSKIIHQKETVRREKPSFKIYVYDLPNRFNSNLTLCVQQADDCYQLNQYGMGPELRQSDHIAYRNTHQHSLEVILHHKMLQSEYRTLNPEEADSFYIPFYPAIACACRVYERIDLKTLHSDLWSHLSNMPYFSKAGHPLRPHFMTLGTIERDHWSSNCPLLRDSDRSNGITFIGVEREINNDIRKYFNRDGKQMIVAPYPSFGHFDSSYTKFLEKDKRAVFPEDVSQTTRDIRIFMAASSRKAHDIRVILKRQMNGTSQRYSTFTSTASKEQKTAVWFNTPECRKNIELPIVDWMRHSVFCLQPPGNSPTRKSFYDAIMAGCIPVTFKPRKGVVKYPFQGELDYGRFTYNIPLDDVLSGNVRVVERLKNIPSYRIKELQKRLIQVAQFLQYSYPPVDYDNDALTMIINEIKKGSA